MTGTDEAAQQKIEGQKHKPASSEWSIRNRGCAVIKQLSSKPQIMNNPRRCKTGQETVVVTLTEWEHQLSSSKINQTAERWGNNLGIK
jgi:hypothetical protein